MRWCDMTCAEKKKFSLWTIFVLRFVVVVVVVADQATYY